MSIYVSVYFHSSPDFPHALCEVACTSLRLLPFLRSGDPSDHHLVMFTKLHQTSVWKALLTLMHTWFMRWLQENGVGAGRQTWPALLSLTLERGPLAEGQIGVYWNMKCRRVLAVGETPGTSSLCLQPALRFHGAQSRRERASKSQVLWLLCSLCWA